MLTFIVTAILFVFAGCPDPDKDVTHPDLDAVLRELETPIATDARPARTTPAPTPRRMPEHRYGAHRPFGGGSL